MAQRTPPQIINAALASAPKGSLVEDRTARVLDALMDAGWSFVAPADSGAMLAPPPTHPELEHLRDLAHVLTAHMEEGQITPAGRELVPVALDRVFPKLLHTRERCEMAECLVHGGCDECPTEAQVEDADARLTTWLAEHPREVVIHKTQSVGKTEMLLDIIRPWQPAGAYPRTAAHIELEDGKRVRFATYRPLYQEEYVSGWLLYLPDAAPGPVWVPTDSPTGRWRHASPLEA